MPVLPPADSAEAIAENPRALLTSRRFLGLAALIVGALAWLLYAAHLVSGVGGWGLELIVAIGGGAVACLLDGRPDAAVPPRLLGMAILSYGVSAACYTAIPDAGARFPSAYDIGLLVFYPLLLATLVRFVRRHVVGFRGILWLDAVIGAIVVAAVGAAVLDPLLDGAGGIRVGGQFAYVLGDLGFLGFLAAACALSGLRGARSLIFLAAGAAALAVGDGIYVVAVAHGAGAPDVLPAVAWPAGILLFAVAPFIPNPPVSRASSPWAMVGIPVASALACLPLAILAASGTVQRDLALLGLTLIMVRMTTSIIENVGLLRAAHAAARTDPLTGLANRQLLMDRLERALARQDRHGGMIAVLFLDLDEFKAINDAHGHELGDQVLLAVGERLRSSLRREDTVARDRTASSEAHGSNTIGRLGSDEFVVLLEGLDGPADAVVMAERILSAVSAPLPLGTEQLCLEASAGITLSEGADGRGPDELLRDSDTAMYEAKRSGKNRYQVFETDMHLQVVARTELIRDLRSAIRGGQLRLLYQPQIDVPSRRMVGIEALVRWEHPVRGLLIPDQFIPVAESSGLIAPIDDWVMREALTQLRAWDDAGLPPLRVAVNVSAHRLMLGDLPKMMAELLDHTGVDPGRVEIELTETVAVDPETAAVQTLRRVRQLGVHIAIDDFGMGHSALSRLDTFPVDRLKIDKSFVARVGVGAERNSIAATMIAMGHSLDLLVVAEGVETQEQLGALRNLGCDSVQGYLFSRPVAATEIARLAREQADLLPPTTATTNGDRTEAWQDEIGHERLIRNLLGELQRLTGLESTYLTSIDWANGEQHITHARNTGTLNIPEELTVDWPDTVCRRALEEGVRYTDDVPASFPGSQAAADLGLQTYLSVPVTTTDGEVHGTLCGASTSRVALGDTAVQVMELFADVISRGMAEAPVQSVE